MVGARDRRTRIFIVLTVIAILQPCLPQSVQMQDDNFPTIYFIIYKSQGFAVIMPDFHGINEIQFKASVNNEIHRETQGVVRGRTFELLRFESWRTKLNIGDVIQYNVSVTFMGRREPSWRVRRTYVVSEDDFSSECGPWDFRCGNNNCVFVHHVCDGTDDCGDNSDEMNCWTPAPWPCEPDAFACVSDDRCLRKKFQCNGKNDCADASDETGCNFPTVTTLAERSSVSLNACDTLTLNCTAVGKPTPRISWRTNRGHIPRICTTENLMQTEERVIGVLKCPNMKPEYSREYTCFAANRAGVSFVAAAVVSVSQASDDSNDCSKRPTDDLAKACKPSVTKVRGGQACSGDVIFEDQFNYFRTDLWQIEQYIPIKHPEYPFVSYQALMSPPSDAVLSVSHGVLRITPKLQQTLTNYTEESIYSDILDLTSGCTGSVEECYREAPDLEILPPVVSGRVSSSKFSFIYGTVYIRAKLPQGDWLYPEILLEPLLKSYGLTNYASGVIKIASARGNKELRAAPDDYGNQVLYGGPIMDFQCRYEMITTNIKYDGRLWGDDFHEYAITWTPEHITLSVDGEEWARVDAVQPLHKHFRGCSHISVRFQDNATNMAPFDDYFYLTLGVAAGGITEFPDNSYSGTDEEVDKPWVNAGRKAMLHFWRTMDTWHKTWTQPELLVDYVKVIAL